MGQILEAKCPCGYQAASLCVGGGMRNFETYCGAPALCDQCETLRVLNFLDPDRVCPECGGSVTFYNHPDLFFLPLEDIPTMPPRLFTWNIPVVGGEFVLFDTEYLCPMCGNRTMRFAVVGHWD